MYVPSRGSGGSRLATGVSRWNKAPSPMECR